MVRDYGLSDALGPVSYSEPSAGHPALSLQRGHSERTQWLLDQEVTALLTSAEARARALLTEHQETLTRLTAALLEHESLTGDQVRALVQKRTP
jgi:cell division protease FtsH